MKKIFILSMVIVLISINSYSQDINIIEINRTKYYNLALLGFKGFESHVEINQINNLIDRMQNMPNKESIYKKLKDINMTFSMNYKEGISFDVENYQYTQNLLVSLGLDIALKNTERFIHDFFNIWRYYLISPVIDEKYHYDVSRAGKDYKLSYKDNIEDFYYILDSDLIVKEFVVSKLFLRLYQSPKFKNVKGKYLFTGYKSSIWKIFAKMDIDVEYIQKEGFYLPSKIIVYPGTRQEMIIEFTNHKLYKEHDYLRGLLHF